MGLLIPIEHPVRVDARRAARVYAALGMPRVFAERLTPRDRAECDAVLAAMVPDTASSVHFAKGAMAIDELERVALADGGKAMYVDAMFGNATVRIWNDRARIQIVQLPPGGLDEGVRIVEETTGLVAPAVAGKYELGDGRMVELASPHLAIHVHTPDRAAAYALFRRFADPSNIYGWISAASVAALPFVSAFVHATGGEIYFDVLVAADVAAELTERVPCDEWQLDHLIYTPETGVLWTYMVAPVKQPLADEWIAKMDDALSRA